MGIIKQATHALTYMAFSAVKAYFGSQGDICDSLGKLVSGVHIQNMICTGVLLGVIGEDNFIKPR